MKTLQKPAAKVTKKAAKAVVANVATFKSPKVKAQKIRVAKVKEKEKKAWVNLTPADCLKSIKGAAHLSSKSVNSNASAVGARLDPADRLPLNFVSVSTLDAARIPVDYVTGATDAGTLKQITSALDQTCNEFFTEIDPSQIAMIESMRGSIESAESVGAGFVDPRLRQIIWPTKDTGAPWLSLTPLQSSGLSEVIRNRLNFEADANIDPSSQKTTIHRRNAVMGIGGSNPQNVGRFVRSMQRPLVFDGPQEVKSIRTAYALHYKGHMRGLAFAPPYKQTLAFALWRHDRRKASGLQMPSNIATRQEELDHIQTIARASLNDAASARRLLEQHQDELSSLTAPTLNAFLRTLIDPELRDRTFKKEFAQKLIRSIERFRYKIGKNEYVVCGDNDLVALISAAEEVCP